MRQTDWYSQNVTETKVIYGSLSYTSPWLRAQRTEQFFFFGGGGGEAMKYRQTDCYTE